MYLYIYQKYLDNIQMCSEIMRIAENIQLCEYYLYLCITFKILLLIS